MILAGHWRIFQRMGGHRYSTDDVVTAWYAGKLCRDMGKTPKLHLDMGCGLGSVLMMVSSVKCHLSTIVVVIMRQFEDMQ